MRFTVDKDVMVAMRDGVELATDTWLPAALPAPTLLVRLPYSKDLPNLLANGYVPNLFALIEAGYAVVFQDCRGTFRSGGDFMPMVNEPRDGADTLEWLVQQPWCDGNVGTFGASYLGFVQWASASISERVRAIAPAVTTTDYYTAPWYSEGGARSWHTVHSWTTAMALAEAQRRIGSGVDAHQMLSELGAMLAHPQPYLEAMPLRQQPLLEATWPWWGEMLAHPDRDRYWQDLCVGDQPEGVTVPALNVGGWFDIFINNTARSFTTFRARAGGADARSGQRLLIGPWDHINTSGIYPDRDFGLLADAIAQDLTGRHLRFFDRWLRGQTEPPDGSAPVRIFVMGIDQWRDEEDWPLRDTQYVDYYLHGSGRANTSSGDGQLRLEAPDELGVDAYLYDPRRPVPSLGGRIMRPSTANGAGPVDQRRVEERDDVLCFSTPVLDQPVEVTGHVSLTLYVSSSAADTDFTGKLVDVFPDGRAIFLTDGILRARYRRSLAEPELLVPDHVYQVDLDLSVTSNVFLPGHQIRLEISSSNFPRFDRNTNTGGVIAEESADLAVIAVNRILHGPDHPSHLVLPIIRR